MLCLALLSFFLVDLWQDVFVLFVMKTLEDERYIVKAYKFTVFEMLRDYHIYCMSVPSLHIDLPTLTHHNVNFEWQSHYLNHSVFTRSEQKELKRNKPQTNPPTGSCDFSGSITLMPSLCEYCHLQ